MAFKLCRSDIYSTYPLEYLLPTANEAFEVGEACVLSGGKLTKCGATATPAYITMGKTAAGADKVPCIRVQKTQVFETTFSAAPTDLTAGNKVTLHTDGLQVTATTTSGVAEIVEIGGTVAGSLAKVRF